MTYGYKVMLFETYLHPVGVPQSRLKAATNQLGESTARQQLKRSTAEKEVVATAAAAAAAADSRCLRKKIVYNSV